MNTEEIKHTIEKDYGLKIIELEKIKNVYRIKTEEADYCLKMIKYNFPHFYFILSAIKHLQNNDFQRVPDILLKRDGSEYITIDSYNAYLTKWVSARECNYDNPIDVSMAAAKLAQLHNKSEGFVVTDRMQPRVYWYKWPENFNIRKCEILDFKRKIDEKEHKSEFDYLYVSGLNRGIKKAEEAIKHLQQSSYVEKVRQEEVKSGFCHHDYAHHNVLIEENGTMNIIDFDYCILDINLHDLASLLLRKMKNGKWDIEAAILILDKYNEVRSINETDIPIMAAFMEFPQDYWQVGIQYYWEKQPWGEDFFIKKLKKIYEDNDEKQEFINEFRQLSYK